MWYIHNRMLFSLKANPAIWDHLSGPGGHCAKWNKPDTGEILDDTTYVTNSKIAKHRSREWNHGCYDWCRARGEKEGDAQED